MSNKPSPKIVCHWACCQKPRALPGNLCVEHTELSKKLGLKVWPGA